MTIEIHRPELEAMILQRMKCGGFHNVEDVLMQALTASSPIKEHLAEKPPQRRTGADLIAALEARPYPDIDLTPPRVLLTNVRDVVL